MTNEFAATERCVGAAIARTRVGAGPLLTVLHAVQDELGCIPATAIPLIAEALNLSRAEVHGVVSFYHHFRETRRGENVLQLCRAEACQSIEWCPALADHAQEKIGDRLRRNAR
jgi:formate dehydrogenase subunit gamma